MKLFNNVTLRLKIWLYFVAFTLIVFVLMWIFQVYSLENFYERMKISDIKNASEKLVEEYGSDNYEKLLSKIAEENDNIVVGKVDVDTEIQLAQKFGIASIPTLVLIKNGQAIDTMVGLRSKEQILNFINQ